MQQLRSWKTTIGLLLFILGGCYPETPIDPVTGKPDLAPLQNASVPVVAADAAIGGMRQLTEAKLHIFVGQALGCTNPTPLPDLQIQLHALQGTEEAQTVAFQTDVPAAAFTLPLRVAAGHYRAQLWNNRFLMKLASVTTVVSGGDCHLTFTVPCRQ